MAAKPAPSVLIIGNFLGGSRGSFGVCELLCDRLKSTGWTVFWASSQKAKSLRLLDMLATIWRYRGRYQVAQVDVFSGRAFFWAELTTLLLSKLDKSIVLTLHGGALPEFAERRSQRVGRLLKRAHAVTTPSGFLQKQFRAFRDDIQVIPNPIDLDRYPFRQRREVAPRFVWLRAYQRCYDPSLAVRAFAQVHARWPDAQLSMFGPDKRDGSKAETRDWVERLGLQSAVTVGGAIPKSQVPACLARFDVFINSTRVDNAPVSVLEALAVGLCVVSTNVGGIPYLLEPDHTALLVASGDADALAAAMKRVLVDADLAAQLSANGRLKAESCSWDQIQPQWERLLANPLG